VKILLVDAKIASTKPFLKVRKDLVTISQAMPDDLEIVFTVDFLPVDRALKNSNFVKCQPNLL